MSGIDPQDAEVLRDLGKWQAEAAASPANREKAAAWYAHDAWAPGRRPMVMMELRDWADGEGPVPAASLRCREEWARRLEYRLRMLRHHVEVCGDDHVVPPDVEYAAPISRGDFGLPTGRHREPGADPHAFNYRPPLSRLDADDFARLRHRTPTLDRTAMERTRRRLEAVFDGILPVRMRDAPWQHAVPLTSTAYDLVGLENFMLLTYDNPEGLHRLMAFLRDDQAAFLDWCEEQQAWSLNNESDYVGAGSVGFTRDLPAAGFAGSVRCRDRWGGFESQESVSISPEQFEAFVFAYQRPLMERFGKVYYGCCEPVDRLWQHLSRLPNLGRVSVSPWADEPLLGRLCRSRRIGYSRKPRATFVSADRFDEGALRAHFDETVAAAQGCSLEIIQRDVYVTHREPVRLERWVALARQACCAWRAGD